MAINQPPRNGLTADQVVTAAPSPPRPVDDERTAAWKALTTAQNALDTFGSSLIGAGSQVVDAYKELQQTLRSLPAAAQTAVQNIAAVAGDGTLPQEFRNKYAVETRAGAAEVVEALRQAANVAADRVEDALARAMIPPPARDAGERQLRRQELAMMVGGASGQALLPRLIDLVGSDPTIDGELLEGSWLRALLVAHGQAANYGTFREAAIGKLVNRPPYSERAAAAQAALVTFKRLNVRGTMQAYSVIARLALS